MKKLPVALAVSASAAVLSFGCFVLQVTNSSSPVELRAPSPARPFEPLTITNRAYSSQVGSLAHASHTSPPIRGKQAKPRRFPHTGHLQARSFSLPLPAPAAEFAPRNPALPCRTESPSTGSQTLTVELPSPPPNSPAVTIQGAVADGYLKVKFGSGASLPVALAADRDDTSAPLSEAKEEIAKEFEDELLQAAANQTGISKDIGKAWAKARDRADRRFRLMYGKDVYNRESLRLGQESSSTGSPW